MNSMTLKMSNSSMDKQSESVPIIWYGILELHGDLFFASREFHDMVETLPIIHNYALTYALDLCSAENGRVTPLYWPNERRKQKPRYFDDFADLTQQKIYVTPAHSPTGLPPTVIRQYASRIDEYLHSERKMHDVMHWEKNPKKRTGQTFAGLFPLHGYMKVIVAGARFLFYIYNPPKNLPAQRYIRLGKFNTKAKVSFEKCTGIKVISGAQTTTQPINTWDTESFVPLNVLMMRPTPLATVARLLGESLLEVTHPDPLQAGNKTRKTYLPLSPVYGSAIPEHSDVIS